MSGLAAATMSVLMIAVFALSGGGIYLIATRRNRRQGALMLVAAAVMLANVLVWTL